MSTQAISDDTASIRAELWSKMRTKKYRDSFVAAHLSSNTAAQIQTIREEQGLTQSELGKKAGMAQARISVMEDPSYEKQTLTTLKRLASALDVALIVRFVPFSELVHRVADLSPEKMRATCFSEDRLDARLPVGRHRARGPGIALAPPAAPQNDPSEMSGQLGRFRNTPMDSMSYGQQH